MGSTPKRVSLTGRTWVTPAGMSFRSSGLRGESGTPEASALEIAGCDGGGGVVGWEGLGDSRWDGLGEYGCEGVETGVGGTWEDAGLRSDTTESTGGSVVFQLHEMTAA